MAQSNSRSLRCIDRDSLNNKLRASCCGNVLLPRQARLTANTLIFLAGLENLWVILGLFRYWLSELQEPAEASAGGIKGALLRFGGVVDEGATVIVDGAREDLGHGLLT